LPHIQTKFEQCINSALHITCKPSIPNCFDRRGYNFQEDPENYGCKTTWMPNN